KTRYCPDASKGIRIEALVLTGYLLITIAAISTLYMEGPKALLSLTESKYLNISRYGYAFFGGFLGGTMFSLKWLIHTVAKAIWNEDRRLWRFLVPVNSGFLAFAVVILIDSGLFSQQAMARPAAVIGVGFITGYFSDQAMGKLGELAQVLF